MQLLLLLALVNLSSQQSFQKNIEDVFGTPPAGTTKNPPLDTLSSRANVSDGSASGVSCTRRSDEKPGKCVYYYQCDKETQQIITDGSDLIDVRAPPECPKYFEVCCLLPNVELSAPRPANFSAVIATVTTTPTTETSVTSTRPTRDADTTIATTGASATRCGFSNLGDSDTFRERGEEHSAEFLEFPWVVAMLKRSAPSGAWSRAEYVGGGTLIHPQVVLTAAHKVYRIKAEDLKVRAGEYNTQSQSEVYKHQERDVRLIVRHKHYYKPSVLNSIALVFLETPFTLSGAPNIGIACLGRPSHAPAQGTRCYGVGWGRLNQNDENNYAAKLKKIEMPIVSRSTCENALRGTRLGSYFQLHESLTCAGGEGGRDLCGGDGGSPLICPLGDLKDNRYVVTGAVAYGIGCGAHGVPGVYVNVPHFTTWVDEHVRAQGYDTASYTV